MAGVFLWPPPALSRLDLQGLLKDYAQFDDKLVDLSE